MLVKFAAADVLDARLVPAGLSGRSLRRWAHRNDFDYTPRPGYLYVRSRAISSRTNDNHDTFPAEEIRKAYRTFVGKPVFVNHHNANHRRARGVIIDAALHEDTNPDGSPDTWAEVLMEVDAVRFPKLAQAILAGHIDRTSMGTDVAFSKCSFCGNTASNPLEYCAHIPRLKGKWIERRTASGTKESVLVHEICYGLGFFENSLLVEQPADPTAYFLGVEAGPGVKTASLDPKLAPGPLLHPDHDPKPVERNGKWAGVCNCGWYGDVHDADAAVMSQLDCVKHAQDAALAAGYPIEIGAVPHPDQKRAPKREFSITGGKAETEHKARKKHHRLHWGQHPSHGYVGICLGCGMHATPNGYGDATKIDCPAYTGGSDESQPSAGTGTNVAASKTALGIPLRLMLACGHAIDYTHSTRARAGIPKVGDSWTCPQDDGDQPITEIGGPGAQYAGLGLDQWRAASLSHLALLRLEAMPVAPPTPLTRGVPKKPRYADPGDHPGFKTLQVSPDNVMWHWNNATDDEKAHGMRWYEDANHMANLMGSGNSDVTAGILSAYSPQASWPQNIFNAARAIRTGKAVGKGEGAMEMHRNAAQRILNGEHWSQVLTKPKTYAFAHLIATGGRDPDTGASLNDVVIDRHALSVAAGRRVADEGEDGRASGNVLDNPYYYNHVADTYREAARRISEQEGHEVSPHQVQAATWLTRQRLNSVEDRQRNPGSAKGLETTQRNFRTKFNDVANDLWPGALDENMHAAATFDAARSYSILALLQAEAYGETKAPPEVDTLRDESCPICGNDDSWDGDICQVCGYKSPPKPLQDPDLEKARNNDLREDLGDDPDLDPNNNLQDLTAPHPIPGGSSGLSLSSV